MNITEYTLLEDLESKILELLQANDSITITIDPSTKQAKFCKVVLDKLLNSDFKVEVEKPKTEKPAKK